MEWFRSMRRRHDHNSAVHHLERQYNGGHGRSDGKRFQRPFVPQPHDDRRVLGLYYMKHGDEEHGKQTYLNPIFEEKQKWADYDTYYSSVKEKPRRLIVQATEEVIERNKHEANGNSADVDVGRNWGRRKIEAKVPIIIKLAELCLNPLGDSHYDGSEVEEDHHHEDRQPANKSNKSLPVWKIILHWTLSTLYTMSFAWVILLMISAELISAPWSDDNGSDNYNYNDYDNVNWDWPKYALNPLDQSPENDVVESDEIYLNLPRKLVVQDNDDPEKWTVRETKDKDIRDHVTGELLPYIFLSYTSATFAGRMSNEQKHEYLHRVAKKMIEKENSHLEDPESKIRAFWLDMDCIPEEKGPEKDKDVFSISDAVRGAQRVYIVLLEDSAAEKRNFGKRVWTLPEVLLGAGRTRFCVPSVTVKDDFDVHNRSLTDMYGSFWQNENAITEQAGVRQDEAISMLIKHYSNTIKLSDLQLFSYAVQALAVNFTSRDEPGSAISVKGFEQPYLAYAAMGLLSYRIHPTRHGDIENNFQAIARLSLVNDTDSLLERLACLWPHNVQETYDEESHNAVAGSNKLLGGFAKRDQYETHLWDIKPTCQVVGVGEEEDTPTVVLDGCHAIPIRWKSFPSVRYSKTYKGFRDTIASTVVYYGSWCLSFGFFILWQGIPLSFGFRFGIGSQSVSTTDGSVNANNTDTTAAFISYYVAGAAILFACAWVTSFFSPLAVRQLCNGASCGSSNHLIGFEGTMKLRDIEIAMFGNFNNRLAYAPSSTLFSKDLRDLKTRTANQPQDWDAIRRQVPPGHRLFTIVDTGDWTVSLIATERPPIVALVCGREGGMARALLCSWRFENNCLHREYVMRMRSSVLDLTRPSDWLKVSLASQGDVSRLRMKRVGKDVVTEGGALALFPVEEGTMKTPVITQ